MLITRESGTLIHTLLCALWCTVPIRIAWDWNTIKNRALSVQKTNPNPFLKRLNTLMMIGVLLSLLTHLESIPLQTDFMKEVSSTRIFTILKTDLCNLVLMVDGKTTFNRTRLLLT